jgi:hypothetical protein
MNLMRLSFEERHTRYIVQSNEQEIRGISRKTSEIWGTLDSVTGLDLEWLTLLGLPTAQEDSVLSAGLMGVTLHATNGLTAAAAHHVSYTGIIAALKALAVILAETFGNIRVTVFIAIIDIRRAMVLVILASTYKAVLKATPLRVVKLRRCAVPPAVVTVSRWGGALRRVLRVDCSRGTQQENDRARCS